MGGSKKKKNQGGKGKKGSKNGKPGPKNKNTGNGMDVDNINANGLNKGVNKNNQKKNKKRNPQTIGRPKHIVPKERVATHVKADSMKRCQEVCKAHGEQPTGIILDGGKVYSAGRDGKLKTWVPGMSELTKMPEIKLEQEMDLGKPCLSLLLANDCLFCGLQDGRIVAFSKADGTKIEWQAHEKKTLAIVWEQGVLISGGHDAVLNCQQFDAASGAFKTVCKTQLSSPIHHLLVAEGVIFIGCHKGLYAAQLATLHEPNAPPPKHMDKSHAGVTGMVRYQNFLIASLRDGSMQVYDIATGEVKHTVQPMPDVKRLQSIALMENENRLICGHMEGRVTSYALQTMERKAKWQAFAKQSVALCVPAGFDGVYFVAAQDGSIQLWQHNIDGDL